VVLRNTGGGPIKRRTVRIHLHNSVEKLWLTPQTLTIRRPPDPTDPNATYRPNTRYAFPGRGRVEDGTVGDVTFASELGVWGPNDNFFWLDVDSGIQRIAIPADSPIGAPID